MKFDLDVALDHLFTNVDFCSNHPLKECIVADYYIYGAHKGTDEAYSIEKKSWERHTDTVDEITGKFWAEIISFWILPSKAQFREMCTWLGRIWLNNLGAVEDQQRHCQLLHQSFHHSFNKRNSTQNAILQKLETFAQESAMRSNAVTCESCSTCVQFVPYLGSA